MADIVDQATRSRMMAGIRSKDTKPELVVRRGLHARGFRFRLHSGHMPGRPDLVFPGRRAVIFVHGCFWHGHNCSLFKMPASRREFWRAKIEGNRARDRSAFSALRASGWRVLVIWECAMKGPERRSPDEVLAEAADWLVSDAQTHEIRGLTNGDSRSD